jgi:hypothetical protein
MREERLIHYLTRDIASEHYYDLLKCALSICGYFSLVWRENNWFDVTAYQIRDVLRPFQIKSRRTDRWPGTQLFGHTALIRIYQANPLAMDTLARPGSVYSWLMPSFPEDLAFYLQDGSCAFSSIAHEREAWIIDPRLAASLSEESQVGSFTVSSEDTEWDFQLSSIQRPFSQGRRRFPGRSSLL